MNHDVMKYVEQHSASVWFEGMPRHGHGVGYWGGCMEETKTEKKWTSKENLANTFLHVHSQLKRHPYTSALATRAALN